MSIFKKILIAAIVVLIGSYIYGKYYFDINDYRDDITSYLSKKIDYEVTYSGSISLEYDPTARISVTNIIIRDPSKNNSLIADIKELELSIDKEKVINGIIDVEKIELREMIFYGVNVDEMLMKSYTLIKDKKYRQFNKQNYTTIDFMRAKAVINNKVMEVNDINIVSSLLSIDGNGKIDLKSKTLNFDMIGKLREKKDVINVYRVNYPNELYENNIPVKISGPADEIDFNVDLTDIITKQIINPIKEQIIDELEEKILEQIKLPF